MRRNVQSGYIHIGAKSCRVRSVGQFALWRRRTRPTTTGQSRRCGDQVRQVRPGFRFWVLTAVLRMLYSAHFHTELCGYIQKPCSHRLSPQNKVLPCAAIFRLPWREQQCIDLVIHPRDQPPHTRSRPSLHPSNLVPRRPGPSCTSMPGLLILFLNSWQRLPKQLRSLLPVAQRRRRGQTLGSEPRPSRPRIHRSCTLCLIRNTGRRVRYLPSCLSPLSPFRTGQPLQRPHMRPSPAGLQASSTSQLSRSRGDCSLR